jgi:hypothetical protein
MRSCKCGSATTTALHSWALVNQTVTATLVVYVTRTMCGTRCDARRRRDTTRKTCHHDNTQNALLNGWRSHKVFQVINNSNEAWKCSVSASIALHCKQRRRWWWVACSHFCRREHVFVFANFESNKVWFAQDQEEMPTIKARCRGFISVLV